MAIGAGSSRDNQDLANLLKPALARGSVACIGATTPQEYERWMSSDEAFERRFQVLPCGEPSLEATLAILRSFAAEAAARDGIAVEEAAFPACLGLSERFLKGRHFPDKALDVLDQAIAHVRRGGGGGAVGVPEVQEVVYRLAGLPFDARGLDERLEALPQRLIGNAGLLEKEARAVAARLSLTLRQFDVHPEKANAVFLAVGAGQAPEILARVIADSLFGTGSFVVEEELSTYVHEADVNRLTGAPPAYVGHDRPAHLFLELLQRPWSVVLLRNADRCHPAVQAVLGAALRDGYLQDGRGRRVFSATRSAS